MRRFEMEVSSEKDVVDIDFGSSGGHYPWGSRDILGKELGKSWTKHISACKLLTRINSSCSSGRERRKV